MPPITGSRLCSGFAILTFTVSAVISYSIYDFKLGFFLFLTSLSILIYVSIIDVRHEEIDLGLLILGFVSALSFYFFIYGFNFRGALLSASGSAIIPLFLILMSKERWMGWGDLIMALWIGLITTYPRSLIAILFAFLAASISGIIMMALNNRQKTLAFGPYLLIGCLLAIVFGDSVIAWYKVII